MKNFLYVCLIFFSVQIDASENIENASDYTLIVGKPYKVKYSSQIRESEKVIIGAKYFAYFKNYKIITGDLKKRRVLQVELIASDDYSIEYFEEIYVVIKNSKQKHLQGVLWDVPKYMVCLPSETVSDLGMSDDFGKVIASSGEKCKSIYNHGEKKQ